MKKFQSILIVSSLLLSGVLNAKAKSDEVYFERKLPASDQIKILTINPVRMDPKDFSDKGEEKACKKWKLIKAQIIRFFRLSINYSMSPYHHYSQTQCDITGKLYIMEKSGIFILMVAQQLLGIEVRNKNILVVKTNVVSICLLPLIGL
ncbi:unnamed protein product [Commensalibacter communis]|uniref:hypothetical protein n=1 Tax=Commensalibacter communis TaxID=2972786 RepID=UPI0022FFB539|nr:hypothetical protein [Commensalibacter communis]CAI3945186.1 unnamed protein product [Commensalibacter communis]